MSRRAGGGGSSGWRRVWLPVLMLAGWGGCAPAPESPEPLRLGYTISEELVADRDETNEELAAYLGRQLGRPVVPVRAESYGRAVEALARGEIDFMRLGPFAFVKGRKLGVIEALVVTGSTDGLTRSYRSLLITNRDTGVTRLEDLPGRMDGLRVNYTDPSSNSGYLIPAARLQQLGVAPRADFASWEYTLSHAVSVLNVAHGAADIAGVSGSVWDRLRASGRVDDRNVVVLWESAHLPSGPMAVRTALDEATKTALRDALVEMATRDPQVWAGGAAGLEGPDQVFLPPPAGHYDELAALAEALTDAGLAESLEAPGSSR